MNEPPTPEEKLQKELTEAHTRIRYLERRLERLGAINSFMLKYDQPHLRDLEMSSKGD